MKLHKLSNRNTTLMTAICSICGPVSIIATGVNVYRCKTLERQRMQRKCTKAKIPNQYHIKILNSQKGLCAICGIHTTERLVLDHDHKNGMIRGLLCNNCNSGIGLLGDNIANLKAAIKYLRKKPTKYRYYRRHGRGMPVLPHEIQPCTRNNHHR